MSEPKKIKRSRILYGILKAQKLMLERKAKLGESVVYADAEGKPYLISAEEALKRYKDIDTNS